MVYHGLNMMMTKIFLQSSSLTAKQEKPTAGAINLAKISMIKVTNGHLLRADQQDNSNVEDFGYTVIV